MRIRQRIQKITKRTWNVVLCVSVLCLFISSWFCLMLHQTRNEWQDTLQGLQEKQQVLSALPVLTDVSDMFQADDSISALEAGSQDTAVQILSMQSESTASHAYQLEVMGTYENLIYFLNHLSQQRPLWQVQLQSMEPEGELIHAKWILGK